MRKIVLGLSLICSFSSFAKSISLKMANNFNEALLYNQNGSKFLALISNKNSQEEVVSDAALLCSNTLIGGGYRFEDIIPDRFVYTDKTTCFNMLTAIENNSSGIILNYRCDKICEVISYSLNF